MHDKPRFHGKKVVVTGAAAGIGAACFAAEGAQLLLIDRAEDIFGVAERLGAAALRLDLAEHETAPRIAAEAASRWGGVDVLVNNAGIGGSKRLEESDDALLDRIVEVNLMAVVRLTRDLTPLMAAPGGRSVNVSSAFGLVGYPGTTAYAIAKAGVAQLTRRQAGELGPRGITVDAIAPGVVETALIGRSCSIRPISAFRSTRSRSAGWDGRRSRRRR